MKIFAKLIMVTGVLVAQASLASVFLNKATVVLKPGTAAKYFAAAKEFKIVSETRREPGNIQYKLVYNQTRPNIVVFEEVWKSKQDLDLHLQTQHMGAFFKSINFDPSLYDISVNNGVVTFTPKMGNLNYVIEKLVLDGKEQL